MPPEETTMRRAARRSIAGLFGRGELAAPRFEFSFADGDTEAFGAEPWAVRAFELSERIGEPYSATIDLIAPVGAWELDALLGCRVHLQVSRAEQSRSVAALITAVDYCGAIAEGHRVRVNVGPAIALLANARRCRVFQDQTAIEIATAVVADVHALHGGSLNATNLSRDYPPLDYCVQHEETDLQFLLRVLADAGVSLLFRHERNAETLVLCDSPNTLPFAGLDPLDEPEDTEPPMVPRWHGDPNGIVTESITDARQRMRASSGSWSATTWGWKTRPPTRMQSAIEVNGGRSAFGGIEVTEMRRPNEGPHSDGLIRDDVDARAARAAQRDQTQATMLAARSNVTTLRAGSVFELAEQRRDLYAEQWAVTEVVHRGDAPHVELRGIADAPTATYSNEMRCQPRTAPLVPARRRKPRAAGITTAIVTGPPGEAIHTDRFGRVRVRMLWDRSEPDDGLTSCWLRVTQPWAGEGYGTTYIPRVGAEVVVSFINGDPDRPVCSGSLHNGAAMPTHELPEHRTSTVLRTQHLAGDGTGFHELRFEDGSGCEGVYWDVGGRLEETVRGPQSTTVRSAQSLSVGGNQTIKVRRDVKSTTEGCQRETVHGGVMLDYQSGVEMHVSEAPQEGTTPGYRTKVGSGLYEIDVAEGFVLRCGECRIEMTPDMILIEGPTVFAKSMRQGDAPTAALSLTNEHAELYSDNVRVGTDNAAVNLDHRLVASQGPREASETSLVLESGDMSVEAKKAVSLRGKTVATHSDGETLVGAGELTLSSSTTVNMTSVEKTSITAAQDLTLRGAQIRLN